MQGRPSRGERETEVTLQRLRVHHSRGENRLIICEPLAPADPRDEDPEEEAAMFGLTVRRSLHHYARRAPTQGTQHRTNMGHTTLPKPHKIPLHGAEIIFLAKNIPLCAVTGTNGTNTAINIPTLHW